MTDADITNERPVLINPIDSKDDDPEDHLDIELETGFMCAKNNSRRGEVCIRVFGLNKRDQLVRERKAAVEEAKAKCVQLLMADDQKVPSIKAELKEMEQGALSYTLARRAQIRNTMERVRID